MRPQINVVIFCGGRGCKTIIDAFVSDERYNVSLIINAFDDGKSSGEIKKYFRMLGPSDIRKLQLILSNTKIEGVNTLKNIFDYRGTSHQAFEGVLNNFPSFLNTFNIGFDAKKYLENAIIAFKKHIGNKCTDFNDFSLGNCVYAGSYILNRKSYQKTIEEVGKLLHCRGDIINIIDKNVYLTAIDVDGIIYSSESQIDNAFHADFYDFFLLERQLTLNELAIINRLSFVEKTEYLRAKNIKPNMTPNAKKRVKGADLIIYGPGTTITSLLPTYAINPLGKIISQRTKAKKIFISNIHSEHIAYSRSPLEELEHLLRILGGDNEPSKIVNVIINNSGRNILSTQKRELLSKKIEMIQRHLSIKGTFLHDGNKIKSVIDALIN